MPIKNAFTAPALLQGGNVFAQALRDKIQQQNLEKAEAARQKVDFQRQGLLNEQKFEQDKELAQIRVKGALALEVLKQREKANTSTGAPGVRTGGGGSILQQEKSAVIPTQAPPGFIPQSAFIPKPLDAVARTQAGSRRIKAEAGLPGMVKKMLADLEKAKTDLKDKSQDEKRKTFTQIRLAVEAQIRALDIEGRRIQKLVDSGAVSPELQQKSIDIFNKIGELTEKYEQIVDELLPPADKTTFSLPGNADADEFIKSLETQFGGNSTTNK